MVEPDLGLITRFGLARDRLIGPAAADSGAAGAFARLCWLATGQDRSVFPFAMSDDWVQSALNLPKWVWMNATMREGLAASLYNLLNDAKSEAALDRRDALLAELRGLAAAYPEDAAVREMFVKGLLVTGLDVSGAAGEDEIAEKIQTLLVEVSNLAAKFPDDLLLADVMSRLSGEDN